MSIMRFSLLLWGLVFASLTGCTDSSSKISASTVKQATALRSFWKAPEVLSFDIQDLTTPEHSMAFRREEEQAGAPWLVDLAPAGEAYRDRFADPNRTEHLLDVILSSEVLPGEAECGRELYKIRVTAEKGRSEQATFCERARAPSGSLALQAKGITHPLSSSLPGFLKGIPEFNQFRRRLLSLEERDFPFKVTLRMEATALTFSLEGSHWFSEGRMDTVFDTWIEKLMQLRISDFRDQKLTVGRTDCSSMLKIELLSWDDRVEKLALQRCGKTIFGWNETRSASPFELDAQKALPLYTLAKTRLASSSSSRSASK